MKGAPQVVLRLSQNAEDIHDTVTENVNNFASRGYRCIGVARGKLSKDESVAWEFLGLIPLFDPPRDDTAATIRKAGQLGIEVKMITGDQTAIAIETSKTLNMGQNIFNADALALPEGVGEDSPQAQQRAEMVEAANGFAEVFPEHKFNIVQILQKRGHRTGMTGDGVNDAPALKAGDVGIAVAGSTDAARAAADIVLTSDGLSVIIEAIARARMIFERMRNYCIYRIACTTNLLLFFFFTMMFIDPKPYGAPANVQTFDLPVLCLVLITLLNDGCILTIAYDKVEPSMKPCNWNLREVVILAECCGLIACFSSFVLLVAALNILDTSKEFSKHFWQEMLGLEPITYPQVQSMLYLNVSLTGFLTIFAARTRGLFFTRRPATPLLIAGVFALAMSTVFASTSFIKVVSGATGPDSESALTPPILGLIWAYSVCVFLVEDMAKALLIRWMQRNVPVDPSEERTVFNSDFWQVRSIDIRGPEGGSQVERRSLIVAAQRIANAANANEDTGDALKRSAHEFLDMQQQVHDRQGQTSSLLSKGSLVSAYGQSMSGDPRLGSIHEGEARAPSFKKPTGRPSQASTSAPSARPSDGGRSSVGSAA
eukprot:gnl/TRDRNA2_/TRDRNA2_138421_c2_seq1.p1 gnl/TRDRNA2_/TRDRNA2_138421_c2~~gnl/TRDRNA2_/TRDRNA2_138421_c2_seq1.p1  ORF type:complete len:702 (+),score=123.33 gnl/TRDRNA2_/TRDRNA2_138421_c2_seq1:311-2107(+)